MKEKLKKYLVSIGGKNIQIKESYKSIERKKRSNFIKIVTQFKDVWEKSNELHLDYGISLVQYEDKYYKIIEHLIFEYYGQWAAEIIMWWIYEVKDPKREDYYVFDRDNETKHTVKSVSQLYSTLKKMKILK
jgi:hypothetical protein